MLMVMPRSFSSGALSIDSISVCHQVHAGTLQGFPSSLVSLSTHTALCSDSGRSSKVSPCDYRRPLCVGFWYHDTIAICFRNVHEAISSFRECALPYGLRRSFAPKGRIRLWRSVRFNNVVRFLLSPPSLLQHSVGVVGETFPRGTFTRKTHQAFLGAPWLHLLGEINLSVPCYSLIQKQSVQFLND